MNLLGGAHSTDEKIKLEVKNEYNGREKERESGGRREVTLVVGVAVQLDKYTDVLTNTQPDMYTQSHLFFFYLVFSIQLQNGEWEMTESEEGGGWAQFLITPPGPFPGYSYKII